MRLESKLEAEEDKWGISIKVVEEWEKTFDALLEYYNTKDLRTICKSICWNNRNIASNKLISVDELKKWMKPQMGPSLWKKLLSKISTEWKDQYERDKNKYNKEYKNLLGSDANMFSKSTKGKLETKQNTFEQKDKVSKLDFYRGIIKKLRNGDKQVRFMSLIIFQARCRFNRLPQNTKSYIKPNILYLLGYHFS